MKKYLILIAMFFSFIALESFAEIDDSKETAQQSIKCDKLPIYGKLEDCLTCHIAPSMRLKEEDPHKWRNYPISNMWVSKEENSAYYAFIDSVSHDYTAKDFFAFFRYLEQHKITQATIEIQSFGGSVFEAWRIKGIIEEAQAKGISVTTKVQSKAASAGTIIFLAGTKRVISPTAELMFHELWTFKMLAIESPADKEDEAKVLRHIQDTITSWVASRSKLSKEEINEKTRKKEFWARGTQAVEYGFATGFICE